MKCWNWSLLLPSSKESNWQKGYALQQQLLQYYCFRSQCSSHLHRVQVGIVIADLEVKAEIVQQRLQITTKTFSLTSEKNASLPQYATDLGVILPSDPCGLHCAERRFRISDMHHPVSGINSLILSVSLASHVSTHLLIHLSAHLCHHHHSHHPSLLFPP